MQFRRTVAPVVEPVTIAEAKSQCRIPSELTDEDALVAAFVQAAREAGEGYSGRGWLTQTWVCDRDTWADVMELPMAAPLQSVSSITYYDSDGVSQTLSASVYVVDTGSRPGRITLAAGQSWPSLQSERLAPRIAITYVVGWTTADLVPETLKTGVRLMVGHLYENRQAVQIGVGVGAVEIPIGVQYFWGDRVYLSECA